MQRFFIADIHLNENEPAIIAGFFCFLQNIPKESELYILGDLFDYWIGDDLLSKLHKDVAETLSSMKEDRQINTYFIHGNRDFLLGKRFAVLAKMTLLPEVTELKQGENTILLLHGDTLCSDDKSYQRFRKKMHNRWIQKLFLSLPRCLRQKIANKLRNKSQQHNRYKNESIMDVNLVTVNHIIAEYQANVMIHGHTHKPNTHHFCVDQKPIIRLVLGAWHDGTNYIHMNENGDIRLIQKTLSSN